MNSITLKLNYPSFFRGCQSLSRLSEDPADPNRDLKIGHFSKKLHMSNTDKDREHLYTLAENLCTCAFTTGRMVHYSTGKHRNMCQTVWSICTSETHTRGVTLCVERIQDSPSVVKWLEFVTVTALNSPPVFGRRD